MAETSNPGAIPFNANIFEERFGGELPPQPPESFEEWKGLVKKLKEDLDKLGCGIVIDNEIELVGVNYLGGIYPAVKQLFADNDVNMEDYETVYSRENPRRGALKTVSRFVDTMRGNTEFRNKDLYRTNFCHNEDGTEL